MAPHERLTDLAVEPREKPHTGAAAAIYSLGVLGVSAVEYLPYAFLPILCPLFAVICAITGIGVFDVKGNSLRGKTMKLVEGSEASQKAAK